MGNGQWPVRPRRDRPSKFVEVVFKIKAKGVFERVQRGRTKQQWLILPPPLVLVEHRMIRFRSVGVDSEDRVAALLRQPLGNRP